MVPTGGQALRECERITEKAMVTDTSVRYANMLICEHG
jgi:hypothetical protein